MPEWEGVIDPPEVWCEPFTLRHDENLAPMIAADAPEGFAEVVLRHARYADRASMFDRADKGVLMECCAAETLKNIAVAIIRNEVAEG